MKDRLTRTFELAYECLRERINGGRLKIENEASLQLQFGAIIKEVGELMVWKAEEFFEIELEKPVKLTSGAFGKSGSKNAKIDLYFAFQDAVTGESTSCGVELKFFKRVNHREPNNRYDVFSDIHNLENYGQVADCCYMVVATDHEHYISQEQFSAATADFDFRDGAKYEAGRVLEYRTASPYGDPIHLSGSYTFSWDRVAGGVSFLKLEVDPSRGIAGRKLEDNA